MTKAEHSWQQRNYEALATEINELKAQLRTNIPAAQASTESGDRPPFTREPPLITAQKQHSVMLNKLCSVFALSRFERQLLLLCLAMELDTEVPGLCLAIGQQAFPSMALALSCFNGEYASMAPEAPLSYFALIQSTEDKPSPMHRRIFISEWALLYLTGSPSMDPSLTTSLHAVTLAEPRLASHCQAAEKLQKLRSDTRVHGNPDSRASAIQLVAATEEDQRQVAALLAHQEGCVIYEFNLYHLPLRAEEQKQYIQRLQRELIARQCLLLIDCRRLVAASEAEVDIQLLRHALASFIRDVPNACLLFATQQIHLPRTSIHWLQLPALSAQEQQQLWLHCLPESDATEMQTTLSELTAQYSLTAPQVRSIASRVALERVEDNSNLRENLWQQSREQSRQHLHGLAHIIAPAALSWDDLILPEKEKQTLKSIVSHATLRQQVYHQWGFAKRLSYGLGMCALFAGTSGTGKTMSARIIASLLKVDLYQVDLSSVVDKYIGETEKKLDKIFKAAETSGAVLLFDEADALFGKRTKVQEAKDRYANMGVSFLLQRMEAYGGLSILTSNLRSAMDAAFTRRLRFIVQFPFPSEKERQMVWKRNLPEQAPTDNIDFTKLARLSLAGGAIRNIILQAAFMAAEGQQSISMHYLREAAQQEYMKSEKTLDDSLVRDW